MHYISRNRASVSAFSGRCYMQSFRPRDIGYRTRPVTRLFSLSLSSNCGEHLFRSDRHLIDAYSDRVVNSVRDHWRYRQERPLAYFLCSKRPGRVAVLDQECPDIAHLESSRTLVFEKRGNLMHKISLSSICHI